MQHALTPSPKRTPPAASGWSVGEAPPAHAPLRCSRGRAWRTRGMRASSLPTRAWHALLRCLARAGLAHASLCCRCMLCTPRCTAKRVRARAYVARARSLLARARDKGTWGLHQRARASWHKDHVLIT